MRGGRGGFTLMELSVAIVVTGVIAAMGYGAFASLIDQRAVIREAMADAEQTVALRETLEDWFTHSNVNLDDLLNPNRGVSSITGGQGITGRAANDMLDMETRALTPSMGWGTAVRLFIDDDPMTRERGLTMQYRLISSAAGVRGCFCLGQHYSQDEIARKLSPPPITKELDARVTGLRVEVLDSATHRWYWHRQAVTPPNGLPLAIRVTLEGAPHTPLPPLLRLPFTIAKADRVRW